MKNLTYFLLLFLLSSCSLISDNKREKMLEDESHKPYNQLTIEEKKELDQQNLELKLAYEQQKK
ncbi:hypothetical protein ACE4RV_15895, partial [Acetobacter persici]|uniref:hypothetical protein n=1 Tax=Acetobacter persici TaxID=1076596 RepID=UPI0036DD177B